MEEVGMIVGDRVFCNEEGVLLLQFPFFRSEVLQ
jgi:hypothetical protein